MNDKHYTANVSVDSYELSVVSDAFVDLRYSLPSR